MKKSRSLAAVSVGAVPFMLCVNAHAIVVSDNVFLANGGDLQNVRGTIAVAMEPHRRKSFEPQFLAVGDIGGCTATWIGDSRDRQWSFILTAAHCLGAVGVPSGPITKSFGDWIGRTVAKGRGTYHITELRFPIQNGHGGASTDIAVLKLPKRADILDHAGNRVPRPTLYDGSAELHNGVWFVGYGSWGTGTGDSNGGYVPASGPRRAAAASVISDIFERDHGVGANFEPQTSANAWSRVAPGDSGSAWWQQFNGQWAIVATTNGHHATLSTGARVSKYVDFIKKVYPDAVFFSAAAAPRGGSVAPISRPAVAPQEAFVSPFGN